MYTFVLTLGNRFIKVRKLEPVVVKSLILSDNPDSNQMMCENLCVLIKYFFVGEWRPDSPKKVQKLKNMTLIVFSKLFNSKQNAV